MVLFHYLKDVYVKILSVLFTFQLYFCMGGRGRSHLPNLLVSDLDFGLYSKTTNFRRFQTNSLETTIFEENGRKVSKYIEYIVRNGEIARYEQFLHFPSCLQKTCTYRRHVFSSKICKFECNVTSDWLNHTG